MLLINDTWITAHHAGKLYKARQTKPMDEYLKRKYNWNNRTLNYIHWPFNHSNQAKTIPTKADANMQNHARMVIIFCTCNSTSPGSIDTPVAIALPEQSITSFNAHTHHYQSNRKSSSRK